jgi:hypothetical protein
MVFSGESVVERGLLMSVSATERGGSDRPVILHLTLRHRGDKGDSEHGLDRCQQEAARKYQN